jgi:endonuclease/exonuclease/phosphatase (EEP) superfamily protein YafD
VRALIADVDPDIIGLVEVDDRWLRGVASAVAGYHGRLEHPTNDNFGIALYARAPMAGGIEDHLQPTAIAHVDVGAGRSIEVVLVHPFPPVTAETTASQHAELAELAVRVRELAGPTIVMGDFNTTPWSREFRAFAEETGLCDSRAGWGLQASWPAWLAVMRIPIDHLFATCSVGITGRRIERDVGSDHLPVVVDLVVP